MAKRIVPIDKFGAAKKFKLDISINRGRTSETTNIVEFWTSDDDDDVLLATQKAEENQRKTDAQPSTQNEFTFKKFAAQALHATTSTQELFNDEMLRNRLSSNLTIEEIFGTDETNVFLPDTECGKKTHVEVADVNKAVDASTSQATETRRQLAQERQLKFLMERVDLLKKENAKLQRDLADSNNQASTKEGEVGLLRNELRQARKLLQASKVDRLTKAEDEKNECNEKIANAFKQIRAKDTELNFTTVEFRELKIRNAKSNERNPFKGIDYDVNRRLLRIENLCIESHFAKQSSSKPKGYMYELTKEKRAQKKQRTFFEMELEQLVLNYSQMHSECANFKAVINRIFASAGRVFTEFWFYTQNLELPQTCTLYPYRQFITHPGQSTEMRCSLIQPTALYDMERGVLLRRYIGTLALICQNQSIISHMLLTRKHDKHWILKILSEAITNLSYSFEVVEHLGVLEATSSLLHSLLSYMNSVKDSTSESENDLFHLLKQLVFTRPSPWVFHKLSACMLLCTQKSQLMARMCVNCPSNCFVSDRVRSLYRFGPSSCLIQVYAGLLELSFYSDLAFHPSRFKLLLSVCENHVRFVYQCFIATPEFILRMLSLPSYTDDEKDNGDTLSKVVSMNSDASPSNNKATNLYMSSLEATNVSTISLAPTKEALQEIRCECYVKLCLSVVTIVYQMMYQWINQDNKLDISQVGKVSQIALHLFTLIFREYYLSCLFRDSEETTKHYLSLLCNWWQCHARLLNFEDEHMRFLRQLKDLHFMLKPLHQEGNPTNPNDDMSEWKRIVSNADRNIEPYIQTNTLLDFGHWDLIHDRDNFFNGLKRKSYNFE
ncbi:PREDICTED: ATR-interacting protein mus304 [Drosophila arizonae]|uniref:ATR-interacting protein mus304 n=1 Tax=Drosophila arizonae TaxID=7263 RepID=A0ABM1NNV1_DROAR|nr:PREDICTED: ATR-interacting protein mus304 [Drosophila arizonae]